jgi:predicted Rossmann-fold nucleotide-binding protein
MNASPALHPVPRQLDIDSLESFDSHAGASLGRPPGRSRGVMSGWHVQSVDLRGRAASLRGLDPAGAVFMGCSLPPGLEESLRSRGGLVFPALPGIPFETRRAGLYTAGELYAGIDEAEYESTPDARLYAWGHQLLGGAVGIGGGPGVLDAAQAVRLRGHAVEVEDNATDQDLAVASALAATLHDHAIGTALDAALAGDLAGRRLVGVMGGHRAARGSAEYREAVLLGRGLAGAGYTVATGGGPGAMEAANLGAYLAAATGGELEDALVTLAAASSYRPSVTAWARAAGEVLRRHPRGTANLGIPTWFYGHEPPNLFATHIAKYFANAIREAVLLAKCDGGIVFLPGAAGTVQEVFQDACENYYGTPDTIRPMVLVGVEHWTTRLPAWPLLRALAAEREMAGSVHLVETEAEAVALLARLG